MAKDFLELIKTRRSIRAFLPDDIEKETLEQILDAGIWAPTAGNVQPWHFYLVRGLGLKKKLAQAALGQSFIAQAPVVVVVCADLERARSGYRSRGEELYCIQDTAAAIQNLLLAAHSLGFGTCWVGAFDEERAAEVLDLPAHHRPLALIPVGRPGQTPRNPGRRDLREVCTEIDGA